MRALADIGVRNIDVDRDCDPRGAPLPLSSPRLGRDHRPEAFCTETLSVLEINAESGSSHSVVFDADDIAAAFNRARRPIPRRRSGPPRAHMVGSLRRPTPRSTGTNFPDDSGLGQHRPPARSSVRARRWPHTSVPVGHHAGHPASTSRPCIGWTTSEPSSPRC